MWPSAVWPWTRTPTVVVATSTGASPRSRSTSSPGSRRFRWLRRTTGSGPPPLRDSAAQAIAQFLDTLDGEPCSDLYNMVLHQVEQPDLKAVLEYTKQNQSHAAAMLGLNRGTLRKKLCQHGLLNEPEPPKRKRSCRGAGATASKAATIIDLGIFLRSSRFRH